MSHQAMSDFASHHGISRGNLGVAKFKADVDFRGAKARAVEETEVTLDFRTGHIRIEEVGDLDVARAIHADFNVDDQVVSFVGGQLHISGASQKAGAYEIVISAAS